MDAPQRLDEQEIGRVVGRLRRKREIARGVVGKGPPARDVGEVAPDRQRRNAAAREVAVPGKKRISLRIFVRSEEHTSELQSLMRISYAVFCLKKKKSFPIYEHHQT